MNRFAIFLSAAALIVSTASLQAQTASPYAGQERRAIKALSEEDIRDLLEGRGMGLAKAGELNSYPGPLHVLQLAGELALSATQRATTEALYAGMRDKAQPIGRKIIEAERTLDQAFERSVLTPEQVARYDALRGYGGTEPAHGSRRHGGG